MPLTVFLLYSFQFNQFKINMDYVENPKPKKPKTVAKKEWIKEVTSIGIIKFSDEPQPTPVTAVKAYSAFCLKDESLPKEQKSFKYISEKFKGLPEAKKASFEMRAEKNLKKYRDVLLDYVENLQESNRKIYLGFRREALYKLFKQKDIFEEDFPNEKYPVFVFIKEHESPKKKSKPDNIIANSDEIKADPKVSQDNDDSSSGSDDDDSNEIKPKSQSPLKNGNLNKSLINKSVSKPASSSSESEDEPSPPVIKEKKIVKKEESSADEDSDDDNIITPNWNNLTQNSIKDQKPSESGNESEIGSGSESESEDD